MPDKERSHNIVDLLVVDAGEKSFAELVGELDLSDELEKKCFAADQVLRSGDIGAAHLYLTRKDEGELATEVLLRRHEFTRLVAGHQVFRQAALTIIQNIYLSQERKIFFGSSERTGEQERQDALHLFSQPLGNVSIPLAKTFQHMILARVWDRILYKANQECLDSEAFLSLKRVVERLNTLRNIYMLLTTRLVGKITSRINSTYKQSITSEDAVQIGSFGVARAAYRYHPSMGTRFSTYASFWILREIQRQALGSRLIRVPATLLEQISRASRQGNRVEEKEAFDALVNATVSLGSYDNIFHEQTLRDPAESAEQKQLSGLLTDAVDAVLTEKSADILRRRYGIGPYRGRAQSIVEISRAYGVTRGSIYQLEKKAMAKLRKHLSAKLHA